MFIKDKLKKYFSKNLKDVFEKFDNNLLQQADEVKIRLNKCFLVKAQNKEFFCLKNGLITKNIDAQELFLPTKDDMFQTLQLMSDYSIYAFEQQIKNGFITLKGGFRAGLVGQAVTSQSSIKTIKNISSINIRIAKEIKGCSNKIIKYIISPHIKNTIIISPPNCGKTTLLRDIIRNISNQKFDVGVVDERSEIAGTYLGQSEMDLGLRTDVLDQSLKPEGMLLLLRSMAPKVIAVDEIGSVEDVFAMQSVSNAGVKLICTIHAEDLNDFKNKVNILPLIKNKTFERFIVLSQKNGLGTIEDVYNENFEKI